MDNEEHDRNRDARIGDVKRRPGIGVADVQIKKKKVDHVSVEQAICQISQDAGKKKRERYISPGVRSAGSHQQHRDNNQCHNGNNDEEGVVALKRSKCRAGIGDVNQMEEFRDDIASVVRANGPQNPLLR